MIEELAAVEGGRAVEVYRQQKNSETSIPANDWMSILIFPCIFEIQLSAGKWLNDFATHFTGRSSQLWIRIYGVRALGHVMSTKVHVAVPEARVSVRNQESTPLDSNKYCTRRQRGRLAHGESSQSKAPNQQGRISIPPHRALPDPMLCLIRSDHKRLLPLQVARISVEHTSLQQ